MIDAMKTLRRKRLMNSLYIWLINIAHFFLDLLPGPLRTLAWRPFLAKCGRSVSIDHRVYFKYPWLIRIGSDVSINRGAEFYPGMAQRAEIRIGDRVRIAPNVRLHAAGHDPDQADLNDIAASIIIEEDAWVGASAVILPGVHIGRGAVIAAGSLVSRSVEPYCVVAGVPAKVLRKRSVKDGD